VEGIGGESAEELLPRGRRTDATKKNKKRGNTQLTTEKLSAYVGIGTSGGMDRHDEKKAETHNSQPNKKAREHAKLWHFGWYHPLTR